MYHAAPVINTGDVARRIVNLSSVLDRCRAGDVLHVHPSRMDEVYYRNDIKYEFDLVRDLFRVTRRLSPLEGE